MAVANALNFAPGVPAAMTITVNIASVYPGRKRKELQLGSPEQMYGFRVFELAPAERGKYSLLAVPGGYKWLRDFTGIGEDSPTPGMMPVWQDCRVVADSLVRLWTGHSVADHGRPGIAMMDLGEKTPGATLLARLEAQQTVLARNLVTQANDHHTVGNARNITDTHRLMAEWLYGTGAQKLPWFPKAVFEDLKRCPKCAKEILARALGCEHCGCELLEFYAKYKIAMDDDPAVKAVFERLQAGESAEADSAAPEEITPQYASQEDIVAAIEAKPESDRTGKERKILYEHRSRYGREEG